MYSILIKYSKNIHRNHKQTYSPPPSPPNAAHRNNNYENLIYDQLIKKYT